MADASVFPGAGGVDDVPRVSELFSGIDALYFSGYGAPPDSLVTDLELLQAEAARVQVPQPVTVGGHEFMVQAHGWRQYTFLLIHPLGRIGITTSEQFPAYRVQPQSVALLGLGAPGAVDWFQTAIRSIDPDARFTVSRLDLCCDVQGWVPIPDDRHRMVCRSRHLILNEDTDELTGMTFGKRKTAGVMLRIYDKKREVFEFGHDHMYPVWGDRFDPGESVWRVEFEIGRKALLQYGIDETATVFDRVGGLWASITSSLYRLAVETADETRSRWPTDPVWAMVQSATLRADAVPIERLLDHKRQGTLRGLNSPLTGILSSIGALTHAESLDDVLDTAADMVQRNEQWSGRPFMDRVEEKRRR